jgi:hypothetical protein
LFQQKIVNIKKKEYALLFAYVPHILVKGSLPTKLAKIIKFKYE